MVALLSLLAYTVFSKASAASDLRTGIDLIAIAITYKLLVTKIMTSIDNYNKLYAKAGAKHLAYRYVGPKR